MFKSVIEDLEEERKEWSPEAPLQFERVAEEVLRRLKEVNIRKMSVDPAEFRRLSGGLSSSLSSEDAPQIDHTTGTFGDLLFALKNGWWVTGEKVLIYSTLDFKHMRKAASAVSVIFSNSDFQRAFLKSLEGD